MVWGQYAEIGKLRHNCLDVDGSVEMILIGEGPSSDYTYGWSHTEEQSLTLDNLAPGAYEFYIENRFGCSQTIEFEVLDSGPCTSEIDSYWSEKICAYVVRTTYFNYEGERIDDAAVEVVWSYGGLTGSIIEVTFPIGQNYLNLCYDYQLLNQEGEACCKGNKCISLKKPILDSPCGGKPDCFLVVNEVGKKGSDSFVELVVVGNKPSCLTGCDLRKVIIDDNNGNLIKDPLPLDPIFSKNINNGYLKLKDIPAWDNIPLGSMIVIYEYSKSGSVYSDPTDANNNGVYVVHASDDGYLDGFVHNAQVGLQHYNFTGFPTNPNWDFIDPNPGYDGFQIVKPDKKVAHAVAFGQSADTYKGEAATVYANYSNPNNSPDFLAALQDENYLSSQSYVATTNTIIATPGFPNTTANEAFIQTLLDCGKKSDEKTTTTESEFNLSVYPNPVRFSGEIVASSSRERLITLKYINSAGVILFEEQLSIQKGNSDWSMPQKIINMPAGLYIINTYAENKFLFSIKFILSR
jgi:hypothetical protein